jgi:CRP-like cAMP-binding protein
MSPPPDLDAHAELRLIPGLAEVSTEALAELASLVVQKRMHAQQVLVEQGVVQHELQFLVRGAAKVVRSAGPNGGSVVVLDVMRAPCIVGDPSVFDGQLAPSSVVTLRSSHVLALDQRSLLRLVTAHPSLSRALMARLAQEVRAHVRRVDQVALGPVDERVKHLLETLALQHGTPLGQGRFIAIPLRRRDIACMVNATTETVSRLLAKFEREGLARSTRDGIWWRTSAKPAPPFVRRESEPPRPATMPPPTPSVRDGRG